MEQNKKLWFRAKMYGWGWYPISWQGWVLTLLYIWILMHEALRIDARVHSGSDFLINFSGYFIPLTIALLIVCYTKGERPRWRWGEKE